MVLYFDFHFKSQSQNGSIFQYQGEHSQSQRPPKLPLNSDPAKTAIAMQNQNAQKASNNGTKKLVYSTLNQTSRKSKQSTKPQTLYCKTHSQTKPPKKRCFYRRSVPILDTLPTAAGKTLSNASRSIKVISITQSQDSLSLVPYQSQSQTQ